MVKFTLGIISLLQLANTLSICNETQLRDTVIVGKHTMHSPDSNAQTLRLKYLILLLYILI